MAGTHHRGAAGVLAVVFVMALLIGGLIAPAAAQEAGEGDVVVTAIHAIPGEHGFPADVYVGGNLAISSFTRMQATDPFTLPPGDLDVAIYPAGSDPATVDPVLAETLTLDASSNLVVVAQLTTDGAPILSVYTNDTDPVPAGLARFVFRQTSGVPSVDVLVDGEATFDDVASLDEASIELPAGSHEVTVVPADGSGDPLGAATVEFGEGELTAVYAVSSLEADTVDLAVQIVPGLATQPGGVPTGNAGLAADRSGGPALPSVAVLLVVALTLSIAGLALSAVRRPRPNR